MGRLITRIAFYVGLCALSCMAPGVSIANTSMQTAAAPDTLARMVSRQLSGNPRIAELLTFIDQQASITQPDKLYVRAIATEYCYWVAARNRWGRLAVPFDSLLSDDSNPLAPPDQMQRLMSKTVLPDATLDAQRKAQRVYAERLETIQCAHVQHSPPDVAAVLSVWKALAASGDKRGIASLKDLEARMGPSTLRKRFEKDGFKPSHDSYELDVGLFDPDKPYIDALFAGLATGDPYMLANLGHILAAGHPSGYFVFGKNNEVPNPKVAEHVWQLVACDLGWPCEAANSRHLLRACAERAQCDAPNLFALRRTGLDAEDMKQIERIKAILLEGIRKGNWQGIRYVRRGEIKEHGSVNLRTVASRRPFWFGF